MRLLARWAFLGVVAGSSLPAAAQPSFDPLTLPEDQREFLQDGPALLMPRADRDRFADLDAAARADLIREFLADPDPATPTNELTDAIERRRRLAATEFSSPLDVRAQLVFLNGKPDRRTIIDCAFAFRPIEIWAYGSVGTATDPKAKEGKGKEIEEDAESAEVKAELKRKDEPKGRILVYQPGVGEPWRAWRPIDGKRALYSEEMEFWLGEWEAFGGRASVKRFDLQACKQAPLVDRATGISGLTGHGEAKGKVKNPDGSTVRYYRGYAERPWPWGRATKPEGLLDPPSELLAWSRAVAATETAPAPAQLAIGTFDLDFPRAVSQRMVTRAVVRLPVGPPLAPIEDGNRTVYKLLASGVVELSGRVFSEFRVRFRVPAGGVGKEKQDDLSISVETPLRSSQTYLLRLRLVDEVSGAEQQLTRVLTVPGEPVDRLGALVPATGEAVGVPLFAKDAILLVPPADEVALGLWRAEALVAGSRIVKVVFKVDGEQQLIRTRPPYEAEVRLSSTPKEQTIRAEGYDAEGKFLAADQFVINRARGAFVISILEPAESAVVPPGPFAASAEVVPPEGRRIESVEFKLDDQSITTLAKPPWQTKVVLPKGGDLAYLTVVATLDDGTHSEAVRLLNAPENFTEVNVDLIEVFAAVTDGSNQIVEGLTEGDFALTENGRPQTIQKFEPVGNLPLILGLTLDTSGSMESSLSEAESAAAGFLDRLVKPKDRVFAVAFSGRPNLLISPTDDLGAVRAALEGQRALGNTALHDALVSSLFYFRGQRGQKALVLLSDGDDTDSKLSWKDTLEYAKRSGVAVYAIGLKVGRLDISIRGKLNQLAEETGGRAFYIDKASELGNAYAEIEKELRSRYLLAYPSDQDVGREGFRKIEVEVKKRGLKARVARGYYP
ncbi:MAG: VWA domain-containing protein [Acidobacteriota bacterium]